MEYLEEKYPSPAILPKDSLQRAKVNTCVTGSLLLVQNE